MGSRLAMGILFLWLGLGHGFAYLGVVSLLGKLLRLAITSYGIGFGPSVVRFGRLQVCAVPFGAGFNPVMRKLAGLADDEIKLALQQGELRFLDDVPFVLMLGLLLVSPLLGVVASSIAIGPSLAFEAASEGIRACVAGVLNPMSEAPRLLDAALDGYTHGSARATTGYCLGVLVGADLLWLPSNIMFLLSVTSGMVWLRLRLVPWLAFRAALLMWVFAFAVWLFQRG